MLALCFAWHISGSESHGTLVHLHILTSSVTLVENGLQRRMWRFANGQFVRNQEKGGCRRGFLQTCTPLLAVVLWVPNLLPGPMLWVFFVSLSVTLDSSETPFAKTPFSWLLSLGGGLKTVPNCRCSAWVWLSWTASLNTVHLKETQTFYGFTRQAFFLHLDFFWIWCFLNGLNIWIAKPMFCNLGTLTKTTGITKTTNMTTWKKKGPKNEHDF